MGPAVTNYVRPPAAYSAFLPGGGRGLCGRSQNLPHLFQQGQSGGGLSEPDEAFFHRVNLLCRPLARSKTAVSQQQPVTGEFPNGEKVFP